MKTYWRLFILLPLLARAAIAGQENLVPSTFENPCTADETWTFNSNIPSTWQSQAKAFLKDKVSADEPLLTVHEWMAHASNAEAHAMAVYWQSRIFYHTGLIHTAWNGFASFIAEAAASPSTSGMYFRVAALACMNQIQKQYPSFTFEEQTIKSAETWLANTHSQDVQKIIYESISKFIQFNLAAGQSDKMLSPHLAYLSGTVAYATFLATLSAALQSNEQLVQSNAERLFALKDLPESIQAQTSLIHLFLARSYYGLHEYDKSIAEFKKIPNSSNYFTEAISDLSWAQLMKKDYNASISVSQNVLVGGLRKTFSPEPSVVMAISFNELCRHMQTLDAIKLFRSKYEPVYQWLDIVVKSLEKNKAAAPKINNDKFYATTIGFLKNRVNIPIEVGSEWIRSPVFLGDQEEINLIWNERKTLESIPSSKQQKLGIASLTSELKNRETSLTAEINQDLEYRTTKMHSKLYHLFEYMQIIEAETYSELGEKITTDQILTAYRAHQPFSTLAQRSLATIQSSKSNDATWDWGKYSTKDAGAEIWEDELGALRTDVSDRCNHRD